MVGNKKHEYDEWTNLTNIFELLYSCHLSIRPIRDESF